MRRSGKKERGKATTGSSRVPDWGGDSLGQTRSRTERSREASFSGTWPSAGERCQGQGLVEFALVLPVFLLLILGTMNFGYVFAAYTNLVHAAREGVRYGMVRPEDTSGVCDRVEGQVFLTTFEASEVTVSYPDMGGTPAFTCDAPGTGLDPDDIDVGEDRVVIEIEHTIPSLMPLISFSYDANVIARRTITAVGN